MLWILAKHPDFQDKLRKELQEASATPTSMADTIPVSGDGEPIHIAAGEDTFNSSKEVFGPDAEVFRPDRWIETDPVGSLPGIWSRLLTFLGRPRACIGYQFTLMELKVLVAVIICHLSIFLPILARLAFHTTCAISSHVQPF
ncbi:cytochrome P450 monooxygenase [Melampsora larici-populina 98AG31]|uniref:Cytochrome P450 monooxygenase n=1 Tax=Melampsora larici-populina (strain 98AG31 / pathotype 3-4-7) TaxID=747676 RepID=F4R956_MELLP|nr:cytochrome P450 monooxygenase [Melampsora larici-populina 98AG31]EGG11211.1 cytochrome P450 monooxygenase [Melampsora larici-populina 98AG31]